MWRKIICSILLIIIIAFPFTTVQAASDPMSAASPSIPQIFDISQNPNHYITDYRNNYYLDTTAGIFNPIENIFNGLANILFNIQQGLTYILIVLFYFSFEFSFFDIFKDLINSFIGNMQTAFFNEVSIIIICLIGFYFFIKQLKRQTVQFWTALFQTIVIIAFASYYFTHPAQILESVDLGTKEISKMVLTGTTGGTSNTTAIVEAANHLWDTYIHKPWQYLEFGDESLANAYTDQVLSQPVSDARTQIFVQLEKDKYWQQMGLKRVGFELMYLIPMIVSFVILSALCILVIGFQFMTMLIFLMGIFIFVIALVPNWGARILGNWVQKLISTAGTKIILSFFLITLIAFNKALFSYGAAKGWLITLLLQLVIYAVVYLKRHEIVELFISFKNTLHNPNAVNKIVMRTGERFPLFDSGQYRYNYAFNNGYAQKHMRSTFETNEDDDKNSGNMKYPIPLDHEPRNNMLLFKNNRDFDSLEHLDSKPNSQNSTNASNNQEIKQLIKKAEQVLEKQIQVLRHDLQEKSKKTAKPQDVGLQFKNSDTRQSQFTSRESMRRGDQNNG